MKQLRDKLLAILAREDAFFTGEELAMRCGVTRAAVWKAIEEIRAAGEEVTADRRLGYRLTPVCGMRPAYLLRAVPCLTQVEVHDTLPSTNSYAKMLAEEGAPSGTVVIARTQTAGRGRFDRRFASPVDSGIYLSYIVRPTCYAEEAPLFTTCTAVAVSEAVENITGGEVKIKWVNDLWMSDKKICGILTEGALDVESGSLRYAVIGIGLNVKGGALPPELNEIATSVEEASGRTTDLAEMAAAVLNSLTTHLSHFSDRAFLASYRARSALDGREVRIERGKEAFEATVRGVGEAGELLVTLTDGREMSLFSGEVVSVRPRWEER